MASKPLDKAGINLRLMRLIRQVDSAPTKDLAVLQSKIVHSAASKNFWNGVKAHLLIVPGWVSAPFMMIAGLIAAGLPFGVKGVLASVGLGATIVGGPGDNRLRVLLSAILVGLAAASKRVKALVGAAVSCSMCAIVMTPKDMWKAGPNAFMFNYVSRWARDYYERAELRGALSDIRRDRNFFAFHPHGCLCAGFTINGCYNPEFMRLAGKTNWLCDPKLRERNPFFKLMCDNYEGPDRAIDSCDKATFNACMSRGETVSFMPGGFFDAVVFQYKKNVIILKDRKGFIKYCLQHGYRLTPVYTFGECETYYTLPGMEGLRMWIAKNNIPMVAFFGWTLCPFLPLPSSRLLTYVGTAIDCPTIPEPSDSEVERWHGVYMDALRRLFDTHKAEAGYADAELQIL